LSNNIRKFSSITESGYPLVLREVYATSASNILYVFRDNNRLNRIYQEIKFFLPEAKIYVFPAWDTMPYDRVSPSSDIVAKRIETISNLPELLNDRVIILATVGSVLQYLPPQNSFQRLLIKIKKGQILDREQLISNLVSLGFIHSVTAENHGDFAVRGSILDIYAPGEEQGWRLDFFGDEVENIRGFDPMTQMSKESLDYIRLMPTHEVILNNENVELFKFNYKKYFGAKVENEALYQAISTKRHFPGFEHWLPLFYKEMDTIFDYVSNPLIILDHLVENVVNEKYSQISDYYNARREDLERNPDHSHYFPIEPNLFWMKIGDFKSALQKYDLIQFNPYDISDAANRNFEFNYLPKLNELYKQNIDITEKISIYLKENSDSRVNLIGCNSFGSRERVRDQLKKVGFKTKMIESVDEIDKLKANEIGLVNLSLERGFVTPNYRIFSESELFGLKPFKKAEKVDIDQLFKKASSLVEGEIIVHKEHGIGKFLGLETIKIEAILHDFIALQYEGGDKLYLPVENIELISRYGSEEVPLDKLGGSQWKIRKARLKKKIKEIAEELLNIAAQREQEIVNPIIPIRSLYDEFCNRFPYEETIDQLESVSQIEKDLSSFKPMDRLLCGDVGFGKTEVAMRAAFITVNSEPDSTGLRKQVAIVVPTTLLAKQHYDTFRQRFAGMNVRIAHLSRFVSSGDASKIRKSIAEGGIDIIIGTHTLLSNNIQFENLALLVIDEEHHFGVIQKEKLKKIKANVHVLTLSATPIPRTLQMSLSGIKELSILANPPQDRLPVKTYVMPFDAVIIREAILREHYRGGKSFYVSPRIEDLEKLETKLRKLVPEIKMITAHAQMPPKELDKIVNDFYEGKYDLLLATTIVESGLDVPSANTIIINRADMLGLAELYQLRGRVGRGKIRGYAYLTIPNEKVPNKKALKRLEVIQEIEDLGVGFTVATRDMELRGYGNLLGDEQSGHIKEVGVEMYQDMLKEAIDGLTLKVNLEFEQDWSPTINLGISVLIPEDYIPDVQLRINLYKRLASLKLVEDIESFAVELIDRFGKFGQEVEDLLEITKLKIYCKKAYIEKLDMNEQSTLIKFRENKFPAPESLLDYVLKNPLRVKLNADQRLVFKAPSVPLLRIDNAKKIISLLISFIDTK
jgi:transcription-repair coupling factor (superfamily II helicase)